MWDILIPLLLVIVLLPLIMHLAVYDCGYSIYDWYSDNSVIADFYCYYKSYFFDMIGIFAVIILTFRFILYRQSWKNSRIFLPFLLYGITVIISTVLSVNPMASLQGNFESFESCLVLMCYPLVALYAYQVMEEDRDYRIIWRGILAIAVIFCVIGIFQVFHHDLANFSWVQRLLMSGEEYANYAGEMTDTFTGNNVYLTLYNPNYAGIFLSMLQVAVLVVAVTEQEKKKQIGYFILELFLLVLLWYTYSRASLIISVVLSVTALLYLRKRINRAGRRMDKKAAAGKSIIWKAAVGFVLLAAGLILLDGSNNWKYLSRMVDKNDREPLECMTTEEDGIHITYGGVNYRIWTEGQRLFLESEAGVVKAEREEELSLPMETGAKAVFYEKETEQIVLFLADNTLTFVKKEDSYYYQTVAGKLTRMEKVEKVDLHGLEYLASARGYIWSRTLPLLKQFLIFGSGPDTFAEVFPQQDYSGKLVYADRSDRIIEKAHNDYLTKWVQTGMLSVVCIFTFYVCFLWQAGKYYKKLQQLDSFSARLGYGCYLASIGYMIAGLVNDSTIQTTPLFYVFMGIALAGSVEKKEY